MKSQFKVQKFIEYIKANKVFTIIDEVRKYSEERAKNERIYIVGGFVRDFFLDRPNLDVDFVTEENAIEFARELVKSRSIPEKSAKFHEKFCTATIPMFMDDQNEIKIDFCTAREEKYCSPAVLPAVEINTTIDVDLHRRDFTINAMAVQIAPEFGNLIDLYNGEIDISNKIIRSLHDQSYRDDPTRIFRAFRFAHRFDYSISENDHRLMMEAVADGHYNLLTGSRIMHELKLITEEERYWCAIAFFEKYELFSTLVGAPIPDIGKAEERIVRSHLHFDFVSPREVDKLKILLYSIFFSLDEEKCKVLFRRLLIPDNVANLYFLSREKLDQLFSLFRENKFLRNSEVYKLLIGCSIEVLLVSISTFPDHIEEEADLKIQSAILRFLEKDRHEKLTFDGNEVMKHFNIKPGKLIKEIKDKLFDALLDEEVTNDKNDQIDFIKRNFNL